MTSKVTIEAHCDADTLVIVQYAGERFFMADGAKHEVSIYADKGLMVREVSLEDAQARYDYAGKAMQPAPKPE